MEFRAHIILMGTIFKQERRRRPQSVAALPHECIVPPPVYRNRFYKLFLFVWNTARGRVKQSFRRAAKTFNTSIFLLNGIKKKRIIHSAAGLYHADAFCSLWFTFIFVHFWVANWQQKKKAARMKFPADEGATLTVNHIPLWGVIKGDRPGLISIYIVHGHISGRGVAAFEHHFK